MGVRTPIQLEEQKNNLPGAELKTFTMRAKPFGQCFFLLERVFAGGQRAS
jgi:hypothetical protein